MLVTKYPGEEFPTCPICGLQDTIQRPNIHVRTKYDESIFGLYILQDPSAKWNLTYVGEWLARVLGPDATLCLEEKENMDVIVHGMMMDLSEDPFPNAFNWTRVSSPIVLIQILKDENLFTILLDPKLLD